MSGGGWKQLYLRDVDLSLYDAIHSPPSRKVSGQVLWRSDCGGPPRRHVSPPEEQHIINHLKKTRGVVVDVGPDEDDTSGHALVSVMPTKLLYEDKEEQEAFKHGMVYETIENAQLKQSGKSDQPAFTTSSSKKEGYSPERPVKDPLLSSIMPLEGTVAAAGSYPAVAHLEDDQTNIEPGRLCDYIDMYHQKLQDWERTTPPGITMYRLMSQKFRMVLHAFMVMPGVVDDVAEHQDHAIIEFHVNRSAHETISKIWDELMALHPLDHSIPESFSRSDSSSLLNDSSHCTVKFKNKSDNHILIATGNGEGQHPLSLLEHMHS